MLNSKLPMWASATILGVLAIFVAGFFGPQRAAEQRPASVERPASAIAADMEDTLHPSAGPELAAARKMASAPASLHVPRNLYRREGRFMTKVEDVVKTYREIDAKIETFGGEIVEMAIEGNDDGRRGTITCAVAIDKFNAFVDYVRSLGRVEAERLTASARPPKIQGGAGPEGVDLRELSLVSLQIRDQKIAQEVQESRGLLATSFSRSFSHFMGGLALVVEGLGWIAPYVLVLMLVVAPVALVKRLQRRRQEGLEPLGAEAVR